MNRNTGMSAEQVIGAMNGLQVVGLDIAKQVFQMHTVDMGTGEIINVQIKRTKLMEHFANRSACLIAIEACGSGHHWARELQTLGHTVRLLHAKIVRPFVSGNKTDATDARAILLGVQQPGVKFVGVKSVDQQATLTLHRQREALMKMRIMQTNALRGLLYEFGAVFAKGKKALFAEIEATLEGLASLLPQVVQDNGNRPNLILNMVVIGGELRSTVWRNYSGSLGRTKRSIASKAWQALTAGTALQESACSPSPGLRPL